SLSTHGVELRPVLVATNERLRQQKNRLACSLTPAIESLHVTYISIVSADFESSATKLSRIIVSLSNFSKYAIVRISPSFKAVRGCHDSNSCAREISGRRCRGSFCGNGLWTIRDREPVMSTTMLASCRIENSPGLPILIGPVTDSPVAIN